MHADGSNRRTSRLVLELVELCDTLPANGVRDRMDDAVDDLVRWALGDSRLGTTRQATAG